MSTPPFRPGSVPGQGQQLELLAVPKEGGVTVRFLANPLGILTHWTRSGPSACTGAKTCPTAQHGARSTWKGYAAAELWRDQPHRDWLPVVLEVTERLSEALGSAVLRGQVWHLYRVVGRHKHAEVSGHKVDQLEPSGLRPAFDVRPVVVRVYREPRVLFGATPIMPARQVIQAEADDYVPPTAEAPAPDSAQAEAERKADQAKAAAMLREFRRGKP